MLFIVLWVPISAMLCKSADVVACLFVPRALVFSFFLLFALWLIVMLFLVIRVL
jgi:hypothetical protein